MFKELFTESTVTSKVQKLLQTATEADVKILKEIVGYEAIVKIEQKVAFGRAAALVEIEKISKKLGAVSFNVATKYHGTRSGFDNYYVYFNFVGDSVKILKEMPKKIKEFKITKKDVKVTLKIEFGISDLNNPQYNEGNYNGVIDNFKGIASVLQTSKKQKGDEITYNVTLYMLNKGK